MGFWRGILLENVHLEDRGYWRIRHIGCEDAKWLDLAHGRVQWWALILAIFNLRITLSQCY
jgi:hypothetical protein